jgi:hypothetical protein
VVAPSVRIAYRFGAIQMKSFHSVASRRGECTLVRVLDVKKEIRGKFYASRRWEAIGTKTRTGRVSVPAESETTMAYELVQCGNTQFAIDWSVVRRLIRSSYTAYYQLNPSQEITLSDSRWSNPMN